MLKRIITFYRYVVNNYKHSPSPATSTSDHIDDNWNNVPKISYVLGKDPLGGHPAQPLLPLAPFHIGA
jgi:hypothetical protein